MAEAAKKASFLRAIGSLVMGVVLMALVFGVLALLLPAHVTGPVKQNLAELANRWPQRPEPVAADSVRVLFIGNSFTEYHDMPDMIAKLAVADGERPFAPRKETPGGCTLQKHWEDGRAAACIAEGPWDYVVIQEQSQRGSFQRGQRDREMTPYARRFVSEIQKRGARPLFYMTWGFRDGDGQNARDDSYRAMQSRVGDAYTELGQELGVEVVPVGLAWQDALKKDPDLDLWDKDGRHPSRPGAYLTACVFYAWIYGKSPEGNTYTAGLDPRDVVDLQESAAKVTQAKRPRDE